MSIRAAALLPLKALALLVVIPYAVAVLGAMFLLSMVVNGFLAAKGEIFGDW